jgi:hypothetical protein
MDYTGSLTLNSPTIGALPSGFAANIDTSTPGQVNLDVVKVGTVPGDVNGDHVVNGLDIALVSSHWLQTGTYAIGDANFDHVVNGLDIALISSHWLQTGGGASGGGSGTAVPEPASCTLCAIGMVVGLAWRWRRRRSGT